MANNAIKGITIEIGGDTTKLGKAIAESEKKSRSLQVELRQVEKLLKFDPTNTELLTQKQNILADSILQTSKKLDTLKEAEKQVIAQFEKGEVSEEQVRALQREIIQTEKTLKDMRSELQTATRNLEEFGDNNGVAKEAVAKLEKEIQEQNDALEAEKKALQEAEKAQKEHEKAVADAKKELEDFGEKASEAFDKVKTGVAVVGGATIAGAGYALNLSTNFDKAFNTLITRTGASADEMDELNTAMENVYANNFGESIEDVAESMATVKQNTKLSGDELQNATERALLLRDTFEFDVNESTRSAKMLMDQYGMSAEEAYNLIAQGAQNGLDKNGDLLDTINEYGVHFSGLGLSAEDMFNMLTNGAENGTFSVDKLGDAVKEFGIRVKDGSDGTTEAFKTLGLDVDDTAMKFAKGGDGAKEALSKVTTALFNMDDPLKQNQVGVALFGTMWEDLGADGVKALMNLEGEVSTSKNALEDINNTKYDDIGSALQGLGRTLETDVIKPLGDELKPVVEDAISYVQENGPEIKEVISGVVEAVGDFVGFIVDNADVILSTIVGIGAGMLVWNVASVINSVVGAIKAYQLANEGATIAQALFNAVLNANPIMLLVTVITAVIVAIVAFIATNEGAREKIKAVWEAIKQAFSVVLSAISGFFSSAWEYIKSVWNNVKPYFSQIWEGIKAVFSAVKTVLGAYYRSAWEVIKLVWSVAVSYFSTIWNNIKAVFSVVKTYFYGMFSTAWLAIKAVWNAVTGYFKAIWNTIKGIFAVVKAVLSGNWRDAWEAIKGIVKNWTSYFSGVWNSIKKVFSSVKTWFSSTFSSAWTAVKNVFSNWGSFFSGLWSKITSTFSKIGTNISNAISGSVKSGLNGVISAIEGTINSGIGLINGAIGLINKIPGVNIGKIGTVSFPRLARGGIVDRPTFAEIGEDGAEAVIPLENNTGWLKKVAKELNSYLPQKSAINDEAVLRKLDGIYERLNHLQIVLDTGILVGETIDKIDAGLADRQLLSARGV